MSSKRSSWPSCAFSGSSTGSGTPAEAGPPPRNQRFTATFIIGSWNGKVIFDEPMITREFILAQREAPNGSGVIPVPAARRYVPAGFYMDGYSVTCDAAAKEYRIALTGLRRRG